MYGLVLGLPPEAVDRERRPFGTDSKTETGKPRRTPRPVSVPVVREASEGGREGDKSPEKMTTFASGSLVRSCVPENRPFNIRLFPRRRKTLRGAIPMPNQAKTSVGYSQATRKEGPRKERIFSSPYGTPPPPPPPPANTNRRAARAPWPAGWNGWANSRSLSRCHFPACPT